MRPVTEAQFWDRVDRSGDCWTWTWGKDKDGYGRVRWAGREDKAHRIAWMLSFGPVPAGACVLHRCDNPPCVNPAHLFLGTVTDNNRDASSKGRAATGDRNGARLHPDTRVRGERHHAAKLDASAVRAIRLRRAAGEKYRDIARAFGVTPSAIVFVVRGTSWRHV